MFEEIIRRGTLITVAVLILCVIGVVAALRVPVQMIPDLDVRTITIQTRWPGATPQDVEKEILIEQEEYLRSLPGLERLVARAASGSATIQLEFPYNVDITQTLIRINNALNQVPSYPENVDQPSVDASSFSEAAFLRFPVYPLEGNPRGLDMDMMTDFIDDFVRTRMENVPNVSQVDVLGGSQRQIQIMLDASALADRGLSLADVRLALVSRNRDRSGGEIESGKRRYLLRTIGRFSDISDLESLIIRRDVDSITRLRDVATVTFDHFEPNSRSFANGEPVIVLAVNREPGSNVIDIKYDAIAEMEAINEEILNPAGMNMELMFDDAGYVEASIRNVWQNLILGALFAAAVMYAFLKSGRTTLVAVIGIPICTIAAFIGLLLAGRTINVISLAGVAFAVGMTLDNSIVVLESIYLERRKGLDRMKAALVGVKNVWPAVMASTLTTILVFIPIVFIQEEAGQLYSDVAVAISASILMSMLAAITIIPTAAARIDLGEAIGAEGRLHKFIAWVSETVERLVRTTRNQVITIGVTVASGLFVFLILMPPASYLPEGEEPKTFAVMNAPPGYNLETMVAIAQEVEAYFLPYVGMDPGPFERGEVDVPPIRVMNMGVSPEQMRIIAETNNPSHLGPLMNELSRVYRTYPGMRAFASRGSIISSNEGGTRSVNLDISGPDLEDVYAVGNRAYGRALEIFDNPRVRTTPSSLILAQPLIEILPDWDRASELGLDADTLGFTIATLSDGAYVGEFFRDDDKIDIYFYGDAGQSAELDTLVQQPIYTPAGGIVPLGSVVELAETVDTSEIRRIDGRRTVTLNIIPPDDVPLEIGVSTVKTDLVEHLRQSGAIPNGVSIDISGASDQLDATQAAITENYIIAIVIVYLLLVAIFTHWGYPLLIMTTIPFGAAGGIIGLQLMNLVGAGLPLIGLNELRQPFDMISMLGFLILMGTVVNNPILIVHRAVQIMSQEGLAAREAVTEAVKSRLRPIAMSTITTMVGLTPLVFLSGEGTELYRGVGAIVLFGILGSAIVSLTYLPALTTLVLTWRNSTSLLTEGHKRA